MGKKKALRPGYQTRQVLVDIQVPESNSGVCGIWCDYLEVPTQVTRSHFCTLNPEKKVRLQWDENDELKRSVFCKQHEHVVKQKSCGTFIKSFLE